MVKRIRSHIVAAGLLVLLSACNFAVESTTPTPTPEPTLTPSSTPTASPTVTPSVTPSPTPDWTATPTATPTITLTPSMTPLPSATPHPEIAYSNDQWTTVSIPPELQDGLDRPWYAILSVNERTGGSTNPETPIPESEEQTLYLVDPATAEKVAIIDLPATVQDRVYWAPDGNKLLYFLEPTFTDGGTQQGGLYLLNLGVQISLRVFNLPTLDPRGIGDHRPVWSPDSSQFAIALPTAYAVDIYTVSADGSRFSNLTSHGAYDLWPAWSPDGRRLAFVSDRRECPTYAPGEEGTCAGREQVLPGDEPADGKAFPGGNLFVLDIETGEVQQVSDMWVDGAPRWVSNLQVTFTTGLSDPFSAESQIWLANIQSGTVRQISDPDDSLNLSVAWSPDGQRALYHRVSEPTSLILKDSSGGVIAASDRHLFSRFGFAAAWSPGGEWVAFAGRNNQCPYGLIVARSDLAIAYGPPASPQACDPSYSPDGRWLAYAGILTRPGVDDGRLDLYIAQPSGYGARNVTSSLRGDIRLLGWVGPGSES